MAASDVFGVPGTRLLHALALRLIAGADVRAEGIMWGHKHYLERPLYLPHERTQRQIRRWYRQFYGDAPNGQSQG